VARTNRVLFCTLIPDFNYSLLIITYRCIIDKSKPRWTNVPVPGQGTTISFMAMCLHVTSLSQLALGIDNIVFCTAANATSNADRTVDSNESQPSSKRRKYCAEAPARVLVSAASKRAAIPVPSLSESLETSSNTM
jgi:hypothetical protein